MPDYSLFVSIHVESQKELLTMWIAEKEETKFGLNLLTELKNRGRQDILITCIDRLKGLPEAINVVWHTNSRGGGIKQMDDTFAGLANGYESLYY